MSCKTFSHQPTKERTDKVARKQSYIYIYIRTRRSASSSSTIIINKSQLEMSPLQFTATLALLLACVHLSVGGPLPADNPVTRRTGTEAVSSLILPTKYLLSASCASSANIDLPCPFNVSGCNSTVSNIATNLNYLVYMYGYVFGILQENGSIAESELDSLDFLEMVFLRFSSQMHRYLQGYRRACSDATCIAYQGIDMDSIPGNVTALLQSRGYTHLELVKAIMCQVGVVARNTMWLVGRENSSVRPYKFCRSIPPLQDYCYTRQD